MTEHEDETDHVVGAIDGALSDWATSSDAMRWTPDPPPGPGPESGRPTQQHMMDLLLHGSAYVDGDGNRVDPADVVGVNVSRTPDGPLAYYRLDREGRVAVGCDPSPLLLHPGFTDLNAALSRMQPRTTVDFQRLTAAINAATEQMQETWAETAATMRRIFEQIPPDLLDRPETPPTDPRERALHARRYRNTGPAKNPHRHRGIR